MTFSRHRAIPRWRRAVVLLVGGLAVTLVIAPIGGARLYWMPLMLGPTYLAAAAVGGRDGALWAPGLVVTFWGGAVAAVFTHAIDVDFTAFAILGIGVGAMVAVGLGRLGVTVGASSIAFAVLLIGLIELAQAQWRGLLDNGWAYGALLAGWGLWELRPESSKQGVTGGERGQGQTTTVGP